MRVLRAGAAVRVPATSANLGPGFDAFGLALAMYDVVRVHATTGPTRVEVVGHGAGEVPQDEGHLVVRALRAGLDHVGAPQVPLALRCDNGIPHGRGLGSSAAAVVAGLVAARRLTDEPGALDDAAVLQLATAFEGHPDNAAPALLGGATIAWMEGAVAHAARIDMRSGTATTVFVPTARLATREARAALPALVPHADAAFNAGRAGLLALALGSRPDLLLPATEDRLHQDLRATVMPASLALVHRLRAAGLPAVVSGAGPAVLVLADVPDGLLRATDTDWTVVRPGVDPAGARPLPD